MKGTDNRITFQNSASGCGILGWDIKRKEDWMSLRRKEQ
jgi:hypothetical protein